MNDVGRGGHDLFDLPLVLAGPKLGHLRGNDGGLGQQHLHRRLEVSPGVLSPWIVLIDAGDRLQLGHRLFRVESGPHVVHGGVTDRTKHVLVIPLLEDAR